MAAQDVSFDSKNNPRSETAIHLAIVDNDCLIVDLIADFMSLQDDIVVSYKAYSGNAFLEKIAESKEKCDIILLDLKMNDGSGLETMEKLKKEESNIKVIALSSYYNNAYVGHMMRSGFSAFLPKETTKEQLLETVYGVNKKGHYLTNNQVETLRNQVSHRAAVLKVQSSDALTPREIDVLRLLCEQCTAKEISSKLFISVKTVETHKSNLLLKTGAKNTAGLVVYAIQHSLIDANGLISF